jgi:hypothetical protein
MAPPYSGIYTSLLPAANNLKRLRQFRKFVGKHDFAETHSLDIGFRNFLAQELKIEHQTKGDLNEGVVAPGKDYEVITNLEVLNHVMNPLVLMRGCHKLLKDNGTMYLSTPRLGWLAYHHGIGNFAEYKMRNLKKLIEYSGFKIIRYEILNPWPFKFLFYGFLQPLRIFHPFKGDTLGHPGAPKTKWWFFGLRPILRYTFHRYVIFELRKV